LSSNCVSGGGVVVGSSGPGHRIENCQQFAGTGHDDELLCLSSSDRAVRMVLDHQGQHGSRWQAVLSISSKIGCALQTLNDWVNKAEVDSGKRAGVSSEMAEKMTALDRENRELRQANEILRQASACFAIAQLDRRSK